jgi:IstB-like ATP binding protein
MWPFDGKCESRPLGGGGLVDLVLMGESGGVLARRAQVGRCRRRDGPALGLCGCGTRRPASRPARLKATHSGATATGRVRGTLEGRIYGVNAVSFSHDGCTLAIVRGDRTVRLWHGHETIATLAVDAKVLPVAFAGREIAVGTAAGDVERASLIVTSNKPFSAWGETFGDEVTATAMIDRLVHHAEILSLKGDSYRLKDRDLARPPAARTTETG